MSCKCNKIPNFNVQFVPMTEKRSIYFPSDNYQGVKKGMETDTYSIYSHIHIHPNSKL